MRAISNLAVSADYRPNILQAKALPLAVSMLRNAQLQGSGSHTFAVLCHAARAIGNLCAGGEIAAAMQQKAAAEGSIAVLLPLLSREREHHEDMQKAGVAHRLSQSMDELLRETVRALAKLSALRQNQRPLVESEQLHLIVKLMGSSETSLGVKAECLELLGHLADVPQVARTSGAIPCAIPCAILRNYSHAFPPRDRQGHGVLPPVGRRHVLRR